MSAVASELVAIGALSVKPKEFSARQTALNPAHVADLAKRLGDGRPLDPLDVWRSGKKLVLVDGFHRLAAYKAAKWPGPVPVRVHAGSRLVAWRLAVEENAKPRQELSPAERADWAWKITREVANALARKTAGVAREGDDEIADTSRPMLAAMTGVSERTIGNMRKAAKMLEDRGDEFTGGVAAPKLTGRWADDRRAIEGGEWSELTDEQRADLLDERLEKLCHDHHGLASVALRNPELVAKMLARVLGGRATTVANALLAGEAAVAD